MWRASVCRMCGCIQTMCMCEPPTNITITSDFRAHDVLAHVRAVRSSVNATRTPRGIPSDELWRAPHVHGSSAAVHHSSPTTMTSPTTTNIWVRVCVLLCVVRFPFASFAQCSLIWYFLCGMHVGCNILLYTVVSYSHHVLRACRARWFYSHFSYVQRGYIIICSAIRCSCSLAHKHAHVHTYFNHRGIIINMWFVIHMSVHMYVHERLVGRSFGLWAKRRLGSFKCDVRELRGRSLSCSWIILDICSYVYIDGSFHIELFHLLWLLLVKQYDEFSLPYSSIA